MVSQERPRREENMSERGVLEFGGGWLGGMEI